MTHQPDCDGSSPPIEQGIEQQGFYVCNFEADDTCPAFSYSVGLRETQNHPDFLTMGLSLEMNSYLCLLYTSPSPRDGLLSRMPSSA